MTATTGAAQPEAVDTAIADATALAELDPKAYAGTVRALRTPVLDRMATSTS